MKWKVMISAPYMQPVAQNYEKLFRKHNIEVLLPPVSERMSENELLEWIPEVDGVISGDDRFTEEVLRSARRLKVISKWGTGIDSIDQDVCRELGIAVRNTPNAFSEPVADSVIGYMLCFARNILSMNRSMRAGIWNKIPGRTLAEYTLGIIGVGNAGKAVARRAANFGMRILGNDLVEMPQNFLTSTGVEMMPKEELLREADFVSLHCDLNPTSSHLMSDAMFQKMKHTAILINTSRGPVVDEKALVRALENETIAGAALDVFEIEPLPAESPLRTMENVILAPHNANSSPRAWERVHESTIRNLLEELEKHQS